MTLLAVAFWSGVLALACDGNAKEAPHITAAGLFSDHVTQIELELPLEAMASLAREPRDYVEGAIVIRQREPKVVARFEHVAVRFKGNRSMRSWHSKPAFKLHFGKRHKASRLAGMKTLVLNNMVDDPTLVREALGYEVFRALQLPAPRTGFAEVRVNGERFGLYAVIEPVEEPLLARSFKSTAGPVYEGEYGCDLYADDIPGLELESGDDPGRRHLRALVEAAQGPLDGLLLGPNAKLHMTNFFGFLAASAVLSDFDGYRHAHNYRLYFDPEGERFSLIPWGLDRILTKSMGLFDSHAILADRCFADHACRLRYIATVRDVAEKVAKLNLVARLDRIEAAIHDAAARDRKRPHSDAKRGKALAALRAHLSELPARLAQATRCLRRDGSELDEDGDGHGCMDCDDASSATHPNAAETCNGVDDDCSGVVDDHASCSCPEHAIEDQLFALCDRPMPWVQARAFCEAQGATLARITSKSQAKELSSLARRASDEHFWIGLNDREREGRAAWTGAVKTGFRYWGGGEPDDHACGQDCAALEHGARGKYRDTHCATPLPFICSRPAPQRGLDDTEQPRTVP